MITIKIKSHIALEEGRVGDMKKKYPGKDDLVDLFSTAPGNNKYLDWMMAHHEEASPEDMMDAIKKFHKHVSVVNPDLEDKDINLYSNFESLKNTLSHTRPPKQELERTGTQKIYDDEEFSITRPTNKEAACKLGVNTKWCIAATKSKNYFRSYAERDAYHYILTIKSLPKENPKSRIAYTLFPDKVIFYPKVEIHDAEDEEIQRNDVVATIDSIGMTTNNFSSASPDKFSTGSSDDDFENDYADAQSQINDAKEKEEKLFQVMVSDFQQRNRSDLGPITDEYYDDIMEILKSKQNDNYKSKKIASKITDVFYDHDADKPQTDPRFIKKHFRKLVAMDIPFVDEYFLKAFNDKSRNIISKNINASIPSNEKEQLIKKVEAVINTQVEEIVSNMYKQRFVSDYIEYTHKEKTPEEQAKNLTGMYEKYNLDVITKAVELFRRENNLQESRLFKFNRDKKMFKFLR